MTIIPLEIAKALNGTHATDAEISFLRNRFANELLPEWLVGVLQGFKLGGASISLAEDYDLSGLGAELKWFTPEQMISESFEDEPGLTVVPIGLLPVAACAIGSGDPYFLDLRNSNNVDPPLVRVLHDFVGMEKSKFLIEGIEVVTHRLSEFFAKATVN